MTHARVFAKLTTAPSLIMNYSTLFFGTGLLFILATFALIEEDGLALPSFVFALIFFVLTVIMKRVEQKNAPAEATTTVAVGKRPNYPLRWGLLLVTLGAIVTILEGVEIFIGKYSLGFLMASLPLMLIGIVRASEPK